MNAARVPIVSLDSPSGLDADRGTTYGPCVRANLTLTYGLAKPGFFISQGPSMTGRIKVLPIGFPRELFKKVAVDRFAFNLKSLRSCLPFRANESHKTQHGHALILAGSPGMWGAGILSATAAYRIGAGYVTLASHEDPIEVLRYYPEVLTAKADSESLWQKKRWNSVAIGPGLGTGLGTYKLIQRLIKENVSSVVVDADAISVIAENRLWPLPKSWVLTPHAGELARLLSSKGVSAQAIEGDRLRFALEASDLLGCHVLLKGYRTVVAGFGCATVILSGNSALAKAGTGDVLTGMIVGLMAQKLNPATAAMAGAYIHGRMADDWVRSGQHKGSLQASDLREILPSIMTKLAAPSAFCESARP